MSTRTVASLILAILVSPAGLLAQDHPIKGTWTLNVAKSKYTSEAPPQSRTLIFEIFGRNNLRLTNDAVLADGRKTHIEEDFIQDGKMHELHGSADAETHINVEFDPYNSQTINYKGGKPVRVLKRVISKDGRTLTIIVTSTDANGNPVDDFRVFDKQ